MKVNILSMQRVENYGSFLQAYGLKKIIESLGVSVSFMDIPIGEKLPDDIIKTTVHEYSNNRKLDKYFVRRLKSKFVNKKLSKMFKQVHSQYLGLDSNYNAEATADTVVIGSDEVFNCLQPSNWGYSRSLLGGIKDKNVITYAASCGFTTYNDLNNYLKEDITKSLSNLTSISVRDHNTAYFVKQFGFSNYVESLDPVLVSNFDEELLTIKQNPIPYDKYMIVYAYKNRIHKENEIQDIKNFALKYNLKIIALGGDQVWADDFFVLTPFELLNAFKKASFIVTDTFHGSIFAIKYKLNYITLIRESNKYKLTDLLERLKQSDRLVTNLNDIESKFNEYPNYEETMDIIMQETLKSRGYLNEALRIDINE